MWLIYCYCLIHIPDQIYRNDLLQHCMKGKSDDCEVVQQLLDSGATIDIQTEVHVCFAQLDYAKKLTLSFSETHIASYRKMAHIHCT